MRCACLSVWLPSLTEPLADGQVQEAVKELQQQFGKNRVVVRLPAGAGTVHICLVACCARSFCCSSARESLG